MEDQAYDQLSLKEYIAPFTGEPVIANHQFTLVVVIVVDTLESESPGTVASFYVYFLYFCKP